MAVLGAGALYFAIVFVIAFGFGVLRTLLLEPLLGETLAVACEVPFLIAAFVFAARFVLRRFTSVRGAASLLAMGVIALVLQQSAELAMVMLSGQTLQSHLAYLSTLAGRLYLSAVVVFVLAPLALAPRRQRKSADRGSGPRSVE
ncbi:MAG: hypothetical protein NW206_11515 [Hyphomonadaceae bacterium]|nr:hypothetical protein [Hyphomonadaceae bacterium]